MSESSRKPNDHSLCLTGFEPSLSMGDEYPRPEVNGRPLREWPDGTPMILLADELNCTGGTSLDGALKRLADIVDQRRDRAPLLFMITDGPPLVDAEQSNDDRFVMNRVTAVGEDNS